MAREQPTHREVLDATAAAEETMRPQRVPVNVYETSAALVVLAPLPAVKANDVTVELHGSTLRLWAHVRSAGPRDFVLNEWEYGGYEREIDLPPGYGSGVEGRSPMDNWRCECSAATPSTSFRSSRRRSPPSRI